MRQQTTNKEQVFRRLKALTEGPTPPLHHVNLFGDMVAVTITPWGRPLYLNWNQAEQFTRDLPIELPPARKQPMSEQGQGLKRKRA